MVDERFSVCVCVCVHVREREKRMTTGMKGVWKGEREEESISRDQHQGVCIPVNKTWFLDFRETRNMGEAGSGWWRRDGFENVDLGTMDEFYKDERVRGINRSNRFWWGIPKDGESRVWIEFGVVGGWNRGGSKFCFCWNVSFFFFLVLERIKFVEWKVREVKEIEEVVSFVLRVIIIL